VAPHQACRRPARRRQVQKRPAQWLPRQLRALRRPVRVRSALGRPARQLPALRKGRLRRLGRIRRAIRRLRAAWPSGRIWPFRAGWTPRRETCPGADSASWSWRPRPPSPTRKHRPQWAAGYPRTATCHPAGRRRRQPPVRRSCHRLARLPCVPAGWPYHSPNRSGLKEYGPYRFPGSPSQPERQPPLRPRERGRRPARAPRRQEQAWSQAAGSAWRCPPAPCARGLTCRIGCSRIPRGAQRRRRSPNQPRVPASADHGSWAGDPRCPGRTQR